MYKLKGVLKVVSDTVQISEKFSKREFVVTDTSSQYPQDIMFQLVKDKCSLMDTFMEGQDVEVSFNLRGREWTSPQGEVKYFNTLEAFRVEKSSNTPIAQAKPVPVQVAVPVATEEGDDDLPF